MGKSCVRTWKRLKMISSFRVVTRKKSIKKKLAYQFVLDLLNIMMKVISRVFECFQIV